MGHQINMLHPGVFQNRAALDGVLPGIAALSFLPFRFRAKYVTQGIVHQPRL